MIVGDKEEANEDDNIEEESGYKASFSRLAHGKKADVDPFPQIQKAVYYAESVHNFSKQHPGKVSLFNFFFPSPFIFDGRAHFSFPAWPSCGTKHACGG